MIDLDIESMAKEEWEQFIQKHPQLDKEALFAAFRFGFFSGFHRGSKTALIEAKKLVEKVMR